MSGESALEQLQKGTSAIPMQAANLSTSSLFIVNPFRESALINLFNTHPPIEERIRRLKELSR